jgi:hypothetical protein
MHSLNQLPLETQKMLSSWSRVFGQRNTSSLCNHWLKVAKNGIVHGTLEARASAGRSRGEIVKNPTEDHEDDLAVVRRFGA